MSRNSGFQVDAALPLSYFELWGKRYEWLQNRPAFFEVAARLGLIVIGFPSSASWLPFGCTVNTSQLSF